MLFACVTQFRQYDLYSAKHLSLNTLELEIFIGKIP